MDPRSPTSPAHPRASFFAAPSSGFGYGGTNTSNFDQFGTPSTNTFFARGNAPAFQDQSIPFARSAPMSTPGTARLGQQAPPASTTRRTRGAMEPPITDLWESDATTGANPSQGPQSFHTSRLSHNSTLPPSGTSRLWGETSHGLAHSSVVGGAEHEPRMTPLRRDPSTLDTRFVTPGTLDPFATQGENVGADGGGRVPDTCVTVYGFPADMASSILADFQKCGYILRHKVEPNSNWLHLHFEDSRQAQQALGSDGLVLSSAGRKIMIGVRRCIDQSFLDAATPEDTNDTILGSNIPKKTPARTLTAKPKPVADSTTVLSTPKKEPSYLELAKDMIFGW